MKKIIETNTEDELKGFLGKKVVFMCSNYFYTGKLIGINEVYYILENPSIIYETGAWQEKNWENCESMNIPQTQIMANAVECFFETSK